MIIHEEPTKMGFVKCDFCDIKIVDDSDQTVCKKETFCCDNRKLIDDGKKNSLWRC